MSKSFALALGGGGARGLAHIAVFEALDELGLRPAAIAGSSIGSLLGAAYAAGMSGTEIRRFIIKLVHNRAEVFRRLVVSRSSTFSNLFSIGFGSAALMDAEKFCQQFLPEQVPDEFEELSIPLLIMATDLHRRQQVALSAGPLRPALAASIALPTVMRPVMLKDRVLIDGGATNPLPFDQLRGRADVIVAVDISGEPTESRRDIPNPWECLLTTVLVMGGAITAEKVKHGAPELIVRPKVGAFRALDFLQASAILRAAAPIKTELKDKLAELIAER
jgi:NTE family protein